jgi:hypothetical protein
MFSIEPGRRCQASSRRGKKTPDNALAYRVRVLWQGKSDKLTGDEVK